MAGFFPTQWIDEVRERTDIVEIVSEYVPLRRNGHRLWGLCPFHGEKTASFSVDAEKQMYYCFGCHAGGNVFHFVMGMERMEFPEAVRYLAERAHMEIPETGGGDEPAGRKQRQRMLEALTQAARFFHHTLYSPQGQAALEYLHGRGIADNVIRKFGLGCTAPGRESLLRQLTQDGFTLEELTGANLVLEREGKRYDTFRDRVMFPIFDPRGRVIAFGGRVLGDGQPKYLNSADTPVFNKRRNVYGLNFLKGRKPDALRLVEGYMDVVSLYQHGVAGCVATLGTALTPEQVRLLKRYAPQVLICYDGDDAGQRATGRALDLFEQDGLAARVVVVPGKMDPDEYVRSQGGEKLLALQSVEGTTYRLDTLAATHDLSKEEERAKYAVEAAAVLRKLTSPVELERHIKRLAIETGFSQEALTQQVGRTPVRQNKLPKRDISPMGGQNKPIPDYVKAQQYLLSFLANGERLPEGLVKLEDFTDPVCIKMAEILLTQGAQALQRALDEMEDEQERSQMAEILMLDMQCPQDKRTAMIADNINLLHRHRIEARIDELLAKLPTLPAQEQGAAVMELNELNVRLGRLNSGRKE